MIVAKTVLEIQINNEKWEKTAILSTNWSHRFLVRFKMATKCDSGNEAIIFLDRVTPLRQILMCVF